MPCGIALVNCEASLQNADTMNTSDEQEQLELNEPLVVEGVFFRQGLQAFEEGDFDKAALLFGKLSHSRHYAAHFYLGLSQIRQKQTNLEGALRSMLFAIELTLSVDTESSKEPDFQVLSTFVAVYKSQVDAGTVSWINEEFELENSEDEIKTLALEARTQLEKGTIDAALLTELCCSIINVLANRTVD